MAVVPRFVASFATELVQCVLDHPDQMIHRSINRVRYAIENALQISRLAERRRTWHITPGGVPSGG
jgi:hypothetical protein